MKKSSVCADKLKASMTIILVIQDIQFTPIASV